MELCLQNSHDVTILTRGQSGNPFGSQVHQLIADRDDEHTLVQALSNTTWDIVYDNICYSPKDAQKIIEILEGKTTKLIFTSTLATYEADGIVKTEADFNPYNYEIRMGNRQDFTYSEGKRQAEAVLFKKSFVPCCDSAFPNRCGRTRLYTPFKLSCGAYSK